MSTESAKPVIFISYSHKDEPERTHEGDIHWLTDIQAYLAPAVNGTFELWTDEDIAGGANWENEIKKKLAVCSICVLFVSRHSLASKYVIEVEIEAIRQRQRQGHNVQIYPIVLSPFPHSAAPASLLALNLRPRLDKPLSGFSRHDRGIELSKITDEIVSFLGSKAASTVAAMAETPKPPAYVHIAGLPETAYERLVGREAELKRLDEAWTDSKTNIISLIAEGGAGKSALVNEWLKRLQADNYRGAEAVLGWSFYSQGTKERATSADAFFNWALDKLGIKLEATSATAKADAIAEDLMRRRMLLVLDGVEPLQHALDTQLGELKDQGLRALLRRFAATPREAHGLVVLTSRLAVRDIARWHEDAAPVVDVGQLPDEAGAALLRDNGVWGTDKELKVAAHDFGDHALALGLLASFLKETQTGDLRRRDHIRGLLADTENPGHDHAIRVMESYEQEWLAGQPVLLAIMHIVGLFDRPASGDCLNALRMEPAIDGLTDRIVKLRQGEWERAVARLREARLLAPPDPAEPEALDAHPLVREWFGERLNQSNGAAWKASHGRLYEHLRDTTKEGGKPTLEGLAPLYQAIVHGCLAGRYSETLVHIFEKRICRNTPNFGMFYSRTVLGAFGTDLAAISMFFEQPYDKPAPALSPTHRAWVLNDAASGLMAQGRLSEATPALNEALKTAEMMGEYRNVRIYLSNRSESELLQGRIGTAIKTAEKALGYSTQDRDFHRRIAALVYLAAALHAGGRREKAEQRLRDAERLQKKYQPEFPILYSAAGYIYCDLLIDKGDLTSAQKRALQTLEWGKRHGYIRDAAFDALTLGRVTTRVAINLHLAPQIQQTATDRKTVDLARTILDAALDGLRSSGQASSAAAGLLARAAFRRSVCNWDGAALDLEEVEEIAEPGPMRLFLCDMALERARLAFAQIEAFAPLNGMLGKDDRPTPTVPSPQEIAQLKGEAEKQLKIASEYIEKCGYHRREKELAELLAVRRSDKTFGELPPRV